MVKNRNLSLSKFKKLATTKSLAVSGAVLVATGLILLGVSLLITWQQQKSASATQPVKQAFKSNKAPENPNPLISGVPVHLTIPSEAIDLKVIPGYYYRASNSWTLSLNDAQYGTMTAPANNKEGLTFIYAHYRKGVFLNLPKITPGAQAIVTTENGHTFTYTFTSSVVTVPTDTSLFSYKGKPILVLQTCTGVWYQNRQLFTFELVKAA